MKYDSDYLGNAGTVRHHSTKRVGLRALRGFLRISAIQKNADNS